MFWKNSSQHTSFTFFRQMWTFSQKHNCNEKNLEGTVYTFYCETVFLRAAWFDFLFLCLYYFHLQQLVCFLFHPGLESFASVCVNTFLTWLKYIILLTDQTSHTKLTVMKTAICIRKTGRVTWTETVWCKEKSWVCEKSSGSWRTCRGGELRTRSPLHPRPCRFPPDLAPVSGSCEAHTWSRPGREQERSGGSVNRTLLVDDETSNHFPCY